MKWRIKNFVRKLKSPFIWIRNYFLCLKYPFIKSRNVWTGKFLGYSTTWYDQIPTGWKKAFGKQFLKELKEALIKDKLIEDFRFHQIKEKYGSLRLYSNYVGKESEKVIRKYEDMSTDYCICCGKPAKYETMGWIEFLCEKCFLDSEVKANKNLDTPEKIEEYKEECRIKSEK